MSRRLSWDQYFGMLVQIISLRSDDEETKIGALIIDDKNRIVSTGYNGTPRGLKLPTTRPKKYPYMLHAEQNCLLFAPTYLDEHKLYVTNLFPCSDCAKFICQKGINEIIIVNPTYQNKDPKNEKWNFADSKKMFKQAGIKTRDINVPIPRIPPIKTPKNIKRK